MMALVIASAYLLQRQANSSVEDKAIEAGLIESGSSPALYFVLRNTGKTYANYTYSVAYNTTNKETRNETSSAMNIPPGQTFRYTISLIRPSSGVMVINLRICRLEKSTDNALLLDQTWIVRAEA